MNNDPKAWDPTSTAQRATHVKSSFDANRHAVMLMIQGYTRTQIVCIFAKLNMAEQLASGPKTTGELALWAGLNQNVLPRLLRGFLTCGLIRMSAPDCFELTEWGNMLKRDSPGSLWDMAVRVHDLHYRAWGALLNSIRSEQTAFELEFGATFYEYLLETGRQKSFCDEMVDVSEGARLLAASYTFSGAERIVDVGGGKGPLLAQILVHNPRTTGILFDLPAVVADAAPYLDSFGLSGRYRIVGGDVFREVPADGDIYILKRVLHNWTDERCLQILDNCRRAMESGRKLLVVEQVMPQDGGLSSLAVGADLTMLVLFGGRERTLAEFDDLFRKSGFERTQVFGDPDPLLAIEAVAC